MSASTTVDRADDDYDRIVANVEAIRDAIACLVSLTEWSCDMPSDRPAYVSPTQYGWRVAEKSVFIDSSELLPPVVAPLMVSGNLDGHEWTATLQQVKSDGLIYDIW